MVCAGASLAILVGGLLLVYATGAVGSWHGHRPLTFWDVYRFVVVLAALPWASIGVLLAVAAFRHGLAILETVSGWDLDRSGAIGDVPDIRLVPFRGPAFTVAGIHPDDWVCFVRAICATGDWTQGTWRGVKLPSGAKCDNAMWATLTGELKRVGVIANAGPRSSGDLTTGDPAEILGLLGLNQSN